MCSVLSSIANRDQEQVPVVEQQVPAMNQALMANQILINLIPLMDHLQMNQIPMMNQVPNQHQV